MVKFTKKTVCCILAAGLVLALAIYQRALAADITSIMATIHPAAMAWYECEDEAEGDTLIDIIAVETTRLHTKLGWSHAEMLEAFKLLAHTNPKVAAVMILAPVWRNDADMAGYQTVVNNDPAIARWASNYMNQVCWENGTMERPES